MTKPIGWYPFKGRFTMWGILMPEPVYGAVWHSVAGRDGFAKYIIPVKATTEQMLEQEIRYRNRQDFLGF